MFCEKLFKIDTGTIQRTDCCVLAYTAIHSILLDNNVPFTNYSLQVSRANSAEIPERPGAPVPYTPDLIELTDSEVSY